MQESQSNFDKETWCVNMYPVVKEYLMDLYEYWEPDIAGEDYGRIISIEVWYSPSLNSCIAEIRRDVMTYWYELNWKHYYKLNVVSSLLDINHWYKNQYTCEINPDVEENCELEFYKMRGKLKE